MTIFLNAWVQLIFCFSSSVLASIRTFAQGSSFGHHSGRVESRPHPGLPRPVVDEKLTHKSLELENFFLTCRVFKHEWNKSSQLCLCHFLNWCRDSVDYQGWKFKEWRIVLNLWWGLLSQCRFKFIHDHVPKILDDIFEWLSAKYFVNVVGLARRCD